METKVLQVFYGKDCLPYKDKERSVHFPIVGAAIQGASNTTKIRFYFDELVEEDDQTTTWVVVSKLPNGKIGSEIVETELDSELNEHYALFSLKNFYTQAKGDLFLSLQGYQGGVQVETDPATGISQIVGTPTIQATGSIKLAINYATQLVGSGETANINFQKILADLGTKLGIRAYTERVTELPTTGQTNVFYAIYDDPNDPNKLNIYVWNETTQSYVWVGDNTLYLGDYYTAEQAESFEENINEQVGDIRTQLQSVASGSPKGVYATVDALTAADPDHNYTYVVSATGNWYYWDGTQWAIGGSYTNQGQVHYSFGTIVTDDNYQSLGITSIFDIPKNCDVLFANAITEQMVSGLPNYDGTSTHIFRFSEVNDYSYSAFIAIKKDGRMWIMNYDAETTWKQLTPKEYFDNLEKNAQKDINLQLDSTNYQTQGIYSINDIPKNSNIYIFSDITEQMVSGLPQYGRSGIYLSKFGIAGGLGWWAIAVDYTNNKTWISHNASTVVWRELTFEHDYYQHCLGGIVSSDNYQTLGITSVHDIPDNTNTVFTSDITNAMIPDLPVYGKTLVVIKMNTGDYETYKFYMLLAFTKDGCMWIMNYNAETTWQKVKGDVSDAQHDAGELTPEDYQALGISSLATIPVNTNWYIYGNITEQQVSGLPYYGTGIADGLYLSKFGIAHGLGYWCIAIHYGDNRTWISYNGGSWKELLYSGSSGGGFLPYTSDNIGFTVPINQNDYNTDSESNTVQDSETISNVGCILQLPSSYTPDGTPTKLCITPHGSGGYVNGTTWTDANKQWLRNNGFALLDVNGSTAYADEESPKGDCYGSPRAVMALLKAYEWAVKNYNLEKQVYIFAFSMGGLLSLNFANAFPQLIKCVGLVFPVTDLYGQAWQHPWHGGTALQAKLAKEYWFNDQTGDTWEPDKVVGYNPINNKSTSDGTNKYNFFPVPIKIWHGKADTVVNYQGSVNLINALKKGGNICSLRLVDGVGHSTDWENVYSVEVLDWFNRWQ